MLFAAATAGAQPPKSPGYLDPGAFDVSRVLPPAPTIGDTADRAIFHRALLRGSRRHLATKDVQLSAADMMRNFSWAAAFALTPPSAPLTAALVHRAAMACEPRSRVDVAAAQGELARLRDDLAMSRPAATSCAAETALLAQPVV